MKFNTVKAVKIGGILASLLGIVATSWVTTKENKATLEEFAKKHFEEKENEQ